MKHTQQLPLRFQNVLSEDEPTGTERILAQVRSAPLRSEAEYMHVLDLINKVKGQLGPTAALMLQMEASLRLYNSTKDLHSKDKTLTDIFVNLQPEGDGER